MGEFEQVNENLIGCSVSISSVVSWDGDIVDEFGSVSDYVESNPVLNEVRMIDFFGNIVDFSFSVVFVPNIESVNAHGEGVLSAVEGGLEIIGGCCMGVLGVMRNEGQVNTV